MGFKGIGSDHKDHHGGSATSPRGGDRKTLSAKSPGRGGGGGGGGSTANTPGGQLVRASSLTLASPTGHGYGSGRLVPPLGPPSPSNGRGRSGLGISAEGLAAGDGGDGGGHEERSPLSLASLSPRRVRSSISMGSKRLSAWTLGSAGAGNVVAATAVTGTGGSRGEGRV